MTYATQQNMIDRFGQQELIELTDRNNTGAIDATVLGQALSDANSEIDSYLSGVTVLPLATVPARLTKLAADIARYELYGARCTDQVRQRYQDAVSFMKQVVMGTASLGLDPQNNVVPGSGTVGMNPKEPSFNGDFLDDYNRPPRIF